MKINEVLKEENVGKIYESDFDKWEVVIICRELNLLRVGEEPDYIDELYFLGHILRMNFTEISQFKKWDKVQVRDYFNDCWRNAYFLNKTDDEDYPFEVTYCDKYTYEDKINSLHFGECRPYVENGENK